MFVCVACIVTNTHACIDVLIHEEKGPEREALMVKGRIF